MKARKTKNIEHTTEQINEPHFANQGLLNSSYKRTVKQNFKKACKESIFGTRLHVKSPKLCKTSHVTAMALKISNLQVLL